MDLIGGVQVCRRTPLECGRLTVLAVELLSAVRGSVSAPAGCGKTQLIADILKHQPPGKPALVLTHTNAGKAALEGRIKKAGVPAGVARVSTIDSWAIGLGHKFPRRCGLPRQTLNVENPRDDYPNIRKAVAAMLAAGHVDDALRCTYARLLVDEYQDCSLDQHAIVTAAARTLRTLVFGDPLQAIFRFGGPIVDWAHHVEPQFPFVAELSTPWRWINTGAERLGQWLLEIRPALLAKQPIDLRMAPPEVTTIVLSGNDGNMHLQRMEAAQTRADNKDQCVLVIGEATRPAGQRLIASGTPGAVTVEAVDLRDLTQFGRKFDPRTAESTTALVEFAAEMMTNLSQAQLLRRVGSHLAGTVITAPTELESAVLDYAKAPSYGAAATVLRRLSDGPKVRIYRPVAYRSCVAALESAHQGKLTFYDAVVRARERNRHLSRTVRGRSVGSTLLLKGLESDVCVVLYPEGMDGANLYVALTRGSRRLIVCSRVPIITPV